MLIISLYVYKKNPVSKIMNSCGGTNTVMRFINLGESSALLLLVNKKNILIDIFAVLLSLDISMHSKTF